MSDCICSGGGVRAFTDPTPHIKFSMFEEELVLQKGRFNTVSSYLILAQLSEAFLFFLCLRFGKAIHTRDTVNQLSKEK